MVHGGRTDGPVGVAASEQRILIPSGDVDFDVTGVARNTIVGTKHFSEDVQGFLFGRFVGLALDAVGLFSHDRHHENVVITSLIKKARSPHVLPKWIITSVF